MRPQGLKITENKPAKGYKCQNATFKKYGKEINIHDFIQAGKEGTIASEIIKTAGGIQNLKGANEKLPTADITIDMNMDPYIANQIIKAGKIAKEKIQAEIKTKKEIKKKEENE